MTTQCHPDVIDDGLNVIVNGTVSIVICQTEPNVVADCTSLSGSGGKRITTIEDLTGDCTLSDGTNSISRNVSVPGTVFTDGVLVAVPSGSADLWLAVYDSTRVLLKSDQITNAEMVVGATVTTPTVNFGVQQ